MCKARFKYLLQSVNLLNILLVAAIAISAGYAIFPLVTSEVRVSLPSSREKSEVQAEKPVLSRSPAHSDYIVIAEKNLFHPERRIPPEKKEGKDQPKPEIVLYGTLITDEVSIAYIEDKNSPYSTPGRGKRQRALKKGDSISGYVLKEIETRRIVLVRGDESIIVNLDESAMKRAPETPSPASSAAKGPAQPSSIAPVSGPVPASKLATPPTQQPYQFYQRKMRRPPLNPVK